MTVSGTVKRMPTEPDELVDEKVAGKIICKPTPTLRDWRYRGIGPTYIKVGPKSVRYRRSDLDAWLEANTVRPNTNTAA